MSDEALPIILVSASDAGVAQTIISEVIDNEIHGSGDGSSVTEDGARVWELSNKYYTARVRVCARADTAPDPPPDSAPGDMSPDAHIIYLNENECTSGAALSRRATALAGRGAGEGEWEGDSECAVKLALCACERDDYSAELRQAARKHGYELVSLRSAPAPPHAASQPAPPEEDQDEFSPFQSYQNGVRRSEGSSGCSSPEPDEAECVRRAELLADALGALSVARDLATASSGDQTERRMRAEAVMQAFARALNTDIDSL
ncbi:hypothetical protein NE865_15581 [Phthorimaea operculella]|nr:hypothetical protein NE865_15581 [Phthorimaea operculella]